MNRWRVPFDSQAEIKKGKIVIVPGEVEPPDIKRIEEKTCRIGRSGL